HRRGPLLGSDGPAFSFVAPAPDNPAPMQRVGFAGLGAMGAPMARNLHKAGLLTAAWNRSADKARSRAAGLAIAAPPSLEEFSRLVDVAVVCVSADADVRSV